MQNWNLYLIVGVIIVFCLSLWIMHNVHERHYYVGEGEDRQLYKALHICLPGYTEICHCEREVDLGKWVGTKLADTVTADPEETAGLALLKTPIYPESDGYILKQKDGHWILYKPEKIEKVFTMRAFYRIGKEKKAQQ